MTARERPIIFSAPMVRAIRDGRKTQTRRVVKGEIGAWGDGTPTLNGQPFSNPAVLAQCPYGAPGDRLWVRETWSKGFDGYRYRADDLLPIYRWRTSIHMPRAASRITLEVSGVRVERLQDISEADAQAEGCALECMTPTGDDNGSAIHNPGGFIALWESIHGAGSWDANPFVWCIEFKRVLP